MDDQTIKLLNELESTEDNENNNKKGIDLIQEYKNNSMNRTTIEKPMYFVKVPNNEVFEWFIDLLENRLKKRKNNP